MEGVTKRGRWTPWPRTTEPRTRNPREPTRTPPAQAAGGVLAVWGTEQKTTELALPIPARYDFTVVDDATGLPVAAKLTVIGRHPAWPCYV